MIEPNHQILLDESIGMEIVVKSPDLPHHRIDTVDDFEEVELSTGDLAAAKHGFAQETIPSSPINLIGKIDQNNRHNLAFAGLSQGERLR